MKQRSEGLQNRLAQPQAYEDKYYVELPLEALDEQGNLLDSVIEFTFDTLHMHHLDLRILEEAH